MCTPLGIYPSSVNSIILFHSNYIESLASAKPTFKSATCIQTKLILKITHTFLITSIRQQVTVWFLLISAAASKIFCFMWCHFLLQGSNGDNREVNRLKTGNYFGELGLISKKPRAASVFAVGDVKCAGMSRVVLHLEVTVLYDSSSIGR